MKEALIIPPNLDGWLWFHRNRQLSYAMHHHPELEFNLVVRGTGTYLMSDGRYELTRHSLIWLFPEQEHVLLSQSPDFEMWVGVFTPELVTRTCTAETDVLLQAANPPGQYCRRLPDEETSRLHAVYSDLLDADDQVRFYNTGLAYALLTTWRGYQKAADIPAGTDVHPAVEKAARILRNETDPLPLAQLAAQAGLSPSRLSRVFKQQTGLSLVDFRNRKRMERFVTLYGTGQRRKMLEAALAAGFGSYPQFHRVFKQLMGCSPQEYRRKLG